jgi:lipopolysaccharide export system protein LptA
MKMPSDKTFNGDALEKPVELTVHWNRDMFFNGRYALFHGGIQAEQENSRLACQTLQVFLDRFVSLKETEKVASTAQGQKPDAPAKVQKLVCDKDVRIEDCKREEGKARGKVVSYQCIEAPILSLDNEENVVTAPGPGIVRLLQLGPKDDSTTGSPGMPMQPAGAPKPPGATPPPEEMKLTRINYLGRMFGNNTTRTAVFYDSVEVVHVPTENPNLVIDVDKPLPQGAMYLRCNQLKVYSRKVPGTQTQNQNTGKPEEKTNQELEAHGKAMVQAQEFWGRADVIKYDESKELVVFESAEGNLATLYRVKVRGGQAEEIRGKKIFYWRRTNDFKIEGGTNITAGGR